MNLINITNLKKNYQIGASCVHALRGVNLMIKVGEFSAIAGPSGSGKTTLLNLMGGLDAVTSGSIVLDKLELSTMTPRQLHELRLHKIGFVFQAYNLIPVLTARENVEFTMLLQGIAMAERERRAHEVLEQVGLMDYVNRRPTEMSGGQQQRVAVARAIVTRPSVVLADEPTANLDSETGAKLLNLMKQLNKQYNITFIFSTHDPMVMEYSNRLIRLRDGTIESDETQEKR